MGNKIRNLLSPKRAETQAKVASGRVERQKALVMVKSNRLEIERACEELKEARLSKKGK